MGQQVVKGRRESVVGDLPVEVLAPSDSRDAEPIEHEADQTLERRVVQVVDESTDILPDEHEGLGHLRSNARPLADSL